MNFQTMNASASPEVSQNENWETIDYASIYGKRQPVTTLLTWGYYGGIWGGNTIAQGTLTLTNAATNYIVVLRSTGAISVSTAATNWNNTTLYARVYKLTTAGGVVTAAEDHRAGPYGIFFAVPAVGDITGLGAGVATFLATPSSANLAAAVTGETGTGALVFATNPTLAGATIDTGNLVLSGTASNLAIGSNFISNGGTDAGLSFNGANLATFSAGLTSTAGTSTLGVVNAATFNISSASGVASITSSDGTNATFASLTNTGGTAYIGLNNSTGGSLGAGAGNYGMSLWRPAATGFSINRAGTDDLTISSAGAVTIPSTLGVRALSTLTDGADGTNTSGYKFVSFVSNSAECGNVIRVAQTSAVVFTTSSDARLKTVFGDSDREAANARIMAHRMRDYEWLSLPGQKFIGPLAQEAYAVDANPMLVHPGGDDASKDPWTVNISGFIPDLLMTVQHQQMQIAELSARLAELEK